MSYVRLPALRMTVTHVFTKEEFERFPPKQRGYVVYMLGARADQPNVPDEKNPYEIGTHASHAWDEGQRIGMLEAQDGEE